jgi:hypothetical protein
VEGTAQQTVRFKQLTEQDLQNAKTIEVNARKLQRLQDSLNHWRYPPPLTLPLLSSLFFFSFFSSFPLHVAQQTEQNLQSEDYRGKWEKAATLASVS